MNNKHNCPKCKDLSFVIIDSDNLKFLTCGVNGIVDYKNVRIFNGQVTCANCNAVIFNEDLSKK